ncbi:hypothetical protein ACOSP7_031880 [Xanthoceras sorbifolium]
MAKLVPTFLPLLVLLVFAIEQMNLPMVKGQCSEGLGLCGTDCNERCNKKHNGGGQGSCDNQIHPPLCTCFYYCYDPPSGKLKWL